MPIFTKKQHKELAKLLARAFNQNVSKTSVKDQCRIYKVFTAELAKDNPKFDEKKFLNAFHDEYIYDDIMKDMANAKR